MINLMKLATKIIILLSVIFVVTKAANSKNNHLAYQKSENILRSQGK